MIDQVPPRAALGLVLTLLTSLPASQARAEDASPWQKAAHSAVRLLAGSRSGPVLLGGIAVQLEPGWKTYWRTSGDSGVPPRFDFSKSDNVIRDSALGSFGSFHSPIETAPSGRKRMSQGLLEPK